MTLTCRRDANGCLPLGCYGALGDGRSVALVGVDGSVDWWCQPNIDSVAVFDRLIDPEQGGFFSITPVGPFSTRRSYRPGSNVLETLYQTPTGTARLTESLNSGFSGRLPWSELARRVEGVEGSVTFEVINRFGRRNMKATPWREETRQGEVLHLDGLLLALRSTIELTTDAHVVTRGRLSTYPGSRDVVALLATSDAPLILPGLNETDGRIDRSDEAWREWSGNLRISGPYADHVRRSALALKLLLFSPTAAIAAAATTSLPERVGGGKNYDYRFAWVRDTSYTIKAFLNVHALEEAEAAFAWLTLTVRRHAGPMRTLYKLDGGLAPDQEERDLPGYKNSRPVLYGNKAAFQLQLGIFGDLMRTAWLFVEQGHILDLATRSLLAEQADLCADLWRQPDAGMWELEEQAHYTMSKIGCWVALDLAVTLAEQGQIDGSRACRWRAERDLILEWIDAHCWSDRKRAYVSHAGSDKLDASLLLAARFGFARGDRLAATRDAIRRELMHGPHVYRYSGMEKEEGTFVACGFWMVEALALLGERDAAVAQMDAMLQATGGNLGLLNEEMSPRTGEMLGNMPQALSHLALVHAASAIEETS